MTDCKCNKQYEILATGRAYSTRSGLNITPGFGRDQWLNNYYGPAKNTSVPTKEHIRRKVMEMLESMHNTYHYDSLRQGQRVIGWFDRITMVTVTHDNETAHNSGEYRWTVWGAEKS